LGGMADVPGKSSSAIAVTMCRVERRGWATPQSRSSVVRDIVLHQKHDAAHERSGRDMGELIEALHLLRTSAAGAS
jgi:hypothetical protein